MPEVVLRDKSARPVLAVGDDGITLLQGDGASALQPGVVAAGRAAGLTAALVVLINAFKVPPVDTSYLVDSYIRVTTAGSININLRISFTDETGAALQLFQVFQVLAGATQTALASAVGFYGQPCRFRAKAGTTITVETVGTVTGSVYNAEASLRAA